MRDHSEKPIAATDDAAKAPLASTEEHKFGDHSEQSSKQEAAEDEAAEQLGDFA